MIIMAFEFFQQLKLQTYTSKQILLIFFFLVPKEKKQGEKKAEQKDEV